MNIGKAALASGVSSKMIRYYESRNLIPAAQRTDSGYRIYSAKDVHTLRFIRRARDLGFSIEDIEELLALWSDDTSDSSATIKVAQRYLSEVRSKISGLEEMARTLKSLMEQCHESGSKPDYPVLVDLNNDSSL